MSPSCLTTAPTRGLLTAAALVSALSASLPTAAAQAHDRFTDDDDLASIVIDLATPSSLHAETLSWAQGGFAPVLSLFDTSNGLLLQVDAGSSHICGPGAGSADAAHGFCWDAFFGTQLPAGHFLLVVSQDGNQPVGDFVPGQDLRHDFTQTGNPTYTGDNAGLGGQRFIDVLGGARSGDWAVEFQVTPLSAVPEPSRAALLLAALALLALRGTKRDGVMPPLPIVAATACAPGDQDRACAAVAMDAMLRKPFDLPTLPQRASESLASDSRPMSAHR